MGIRTQWCHGAPGMVATLTGIAPHDDAFTRLLVAGGELTWEAGPLRKGPTLCHGTAGNGLAFLALFERTGDERWLERARALRHARRRPGRAGAHTLRPRPPLVVDRRCGGRALPAKLHRSGLTRGDRHRLLVAQFPVVVKALPNDDNHGRHAGLVAATAIAVTVTLWASAFVGIRAAGAHFAAGPLALGRLLLGCLVLGAARGRSAGRAAPRDAATYR